MKRKHVAKNDFFYAFVMFAMFAVVVFNVAAEFFHRDSEAMFADASEAARPRARAANSHAHDAAVMRAA